MAHRTISRLHRKVGSDGAARPVRLASLNPVVDPFTRRTATKQTDADELPPACPRCHGERIWFIDRRTTQAELVCVECVAWEPSEGESPDLEPFDIPAPVQLLRRTEQDVYRIVRDHDGQAPLHRYEILAAYKRRVDHLAGVSTVAHALTQLRDGGFIRKGEQGWELCFAAV